MEYPTIEQVEKADREQLARWHRFLSSPGLVAVDNDNFDEVLNHESKIMDCIENRFNKMGGFTPEISKRIGW